jgi:hypothetical protein
VAFDTVGSGVHNSSAEESRDFTTRRGHVMSLRSQSLGFLPDLALYGRFICDVHRRHLRVSTVWMSAGPRAGMPELPMGSMTY